MAETKTYKAVRVEKGARGWGGPLTIKPEPGREYVVSITGGGIHSVAKKIAEMTGGIPFDGFRGKVDFKQMACCVIDCGGTARVGVYPMKKVPTIDIHATSPAGPLIQFITADLFVSGVTEGSIKPVG